MKKIDKIIPIITIVLMVALVIFYLNKTEFTKKIEELKFDFINQNVQQ